MWLFLEQPSVHRVEEPTDQASESALYRDYGIGLNSVLAAIFERAIQIKHDEKAEKVKYLLHIHSSYA